jgi:hypothetical protein
MITMILYSAHIPESNDPLLCTNIGPGITILLTVSPIYDPLFTDPLFCSPMSPMYEPRSSDHAFRVL